jgi:hypothetical protein
MKSKDSPKRVAIPATGFDQLDPESDAFVEVVPGLRVLSPMWVEVEDDELGIYALVEVEWSKKLGRALVRRADFHARAGSEVTASALKQFRLTTLLSGVLTTSIRAWVRTPDGWVPGTTERLEHEDEEHYVARIYRMAAAAGYPRPAKAVAEALGVAESTAAQKVSLCRKLKLLPKTTPGTRRA